MDQKFGKNERVYLRNEIEALFKCRSTHFVYPFKLAWVVSDTPSSDAKVRVLISAPARRFKRAFMRNHVKRLVRESYRRNKQILTESVPEGKQVLLAFVFVGDVDMDYNKVEDRMIRALETLKTKLITF